MGLFKKAVKSESKLRLAIAGPSGSGKTYTALSVGCALAEGGPVALVDTESGSASKYADLFDFDVAEMSAPYHPEKFMRAITEAAQAGYKVVILDSLTHAYAGDGGLLALVDEAAKRSKSNNTYTAWKDVTPIQNRLIEAIVSAPIHIVATMRSKTEYVLEQGERGKTTPKKVGMAPIQRDGFEYEFDVFFDMDIDNNAIVQKSRCPELAGRVFGKPGADVANILKKWLGGAPVTVQSEAAQQSQPEPVQPAQIATNGNGHHPEEDFGGTGDDNPFADTPKAEKPTELPETLRKALHAAGTQLYGKGWDAKRPELVKSITKGRTESSKELTIAEAQQLTEGIHRRIEAAKSEPVAEAA